MVLKVVRLEPYQLYRLWCAVLTRHRPVLLGTNVLFSPLSLTYFQRCVSCVFYCVSQCFVLLRHLHFTVYIGFDVAKTGDARIGFVGFPSVGKSTLLTNLAGVYSEVAAYEFTTLTTVPGVIRYKGAKVQVSHGAWWGVYCVFAVCYQPPRSGVVLSHPSQLVTIAITITAHLTLYLLYLIYEICCQLSFACLTHPMLLGISYFLRSP